MTPFIQNGVTTGGYGGGVQIDSQAPVDYLLKKQQFDLENGIAQTKSAQKGVNSLDFSKLTPEELKGGQFDTDYQSLRKLALAYDPSKYKTRKEWTSAIETGLHDLETRANATIAEKQRRQTEFTNRKGVYDDHTADDIYSKMGLRWDDKKNIIPFNYDGFEKKARTVFDHQKVYADALKSNTDNKERELSSYKRKDGKINELTGYGINLQGVYGSVMSEYEKGGDFKKYIDNKVKGLNAQMPVPMITAEMVAKDEAKKLAQLKQTSSDVEAGKQFAKDPDFLFYGLNHKTPAQKIIMPKQQTASQMLREIKANDRQEQYERIVRGLQNNDGTIATEALNALKGQLYAGGRIREVVPNGKGGAIVTVTAGQGSTVPLKFDANNNVISTGENKTRRVNIHNSALIREMNNLFRSKHERVEKPKFFDPKEKVYDYDAKPSRPKTPAPKATTPKSQAGSGTKEQPKSKKKQINNF